MPLIVISGEPQSGSSTSAKLIAKKLNLRHWSAGDYVKSFGKAEKETERSVTAMSSEQGQSKEFHENVDKKQIEEAKKGDVVIDAKLGIHFLKDFADLTVWLACPTEERARRVAERDKVSLEEGRKLTAEIERIGRETYKRIYDFDYFNQKGRADLVIDTVENDPEQVAAKVIEAYEEVMAPKRAHKDAHTRKFL